MSDDLALMDTNVLVYVLFKDAEHHAAHDMMTTEPEGFLSTLRRIDDTINFLITVLHERGIVSDDDLRRIRTEFQIFPSLP